MACNTTVSLNILGCTDYVDFGKVQDILGQFCWSKIDSNYLNDQLKKFKKDDNRDFRQVLNLTMRRTDFIRLDVKLVDLVDRGNRNDCWTLMPYKVNKPENSYDQVQLFARKKENGKFQKLFR